MLWVYIGIGIAVCVLGFIVLVALRPPSFKVERSAEINGPASVAFDLVNNLKEWPKWSPFEKFDPNMKHTYEGPETGVGASSGWEGNGRAGSGKMTIVSTETNRSIGMKLEFIKPFKANNDILFTFEPMGNSTRVTWSMSGNNNFMMKAFTLIMNMEKMVGTDFAEGLANLNRVVSEAK